jgi:hypothetical protein
MRQMFFDARTGKQTKAPDDSGKADNRIMALIKKILPEEKKKDEKPKPKPVQVKKVYDNSIDPDTGEAKVRYDAVKKSKTPPRPMPRVGGAGPKPMPPAPAPMPSSPKVPAPQIKPPVFDPSVIPAPGQAGRPTDPPSPPQPEVGFDRQGGGVGFGKQKPKPTPGPAAPPSPKPLPTSQPPILPPVDPGPPLASAQGGQIFDGKKVRYDAKKKR